MGMDNNMDAIIIMRALGHPQRYALFSDLLTGTHASCCDGIELDETACCVLDLADRHPLAQSTISHHLQILVNAGVVRRERHGTYQVYRVDEPTWDEFRQHLWGLNLVHGSTGAGTPAGRLNVKQGE
ncbi:ArsR family transcriptional regulator [Alicyclobacillaceae bacterium I2511]|nr:ArsR family transcriptional regulator [Alicyclobacillaceae bacterium I2511]